MPKHSFNNTVEPFYQLNKFDFINLFYFKRKMSDIEIIELIERDTGVRFSRTALMRWRQSFALKSRNPHERFQLAVDKKRFNHQVVSKKINYRLRNLSEGYKDRNILRRYSTKPLFQLLPKFKKWTKRGNAMITIDKELFDVVCKVKGLNKNPQVQLARELGFTRQYIYALMKGKVGVSAEFIERYIRFINEHKNKNWSRFFKIIDSPKNR